MKFDVIVGNPPYQRHDGGPGLGATPIYQHFVEQAVSIEPDHIVMVIPSRWMVSGKGLTGFRNKMLNDSRMKEIVHYADSSDVFPQVNISGGISYFEWERNHSGCCNVTIVSDSGVIGPEQRVLNEFDVFVRYPLGSQIVRKIWPNGVNADLSMFSQVLARNVFGFESNHTGFPKTSLDDPVELFTSRTRNGPKDYVERNSIKKNHKLVGQFKCMVGGATSSGGRPDKDGKFYGLMSIRILPPDTITTDSYLIAGHYDTAEETKNLYMFLHTKFVRFLITIRTLTQNITRGSFLFVPIEDFSKPWTDEQLYKKYGLDQDEIGFIESMIRPMSPSHHV
jgi:site-specific DNA-methyltransferase (adenine-specific)